MSIQEIDPRKYHAVVSKLREFFDSKGFINAYGQNRQTILRACEDPQTISTYEYNGEVWPLPQTGQMNLEVDILRNPEIDGLYCETTSFRSEPNPVPGRHDLIFPMFEFEFQGGFDRLNQLMKEMLIHLGFKTDTDGNYPGGDYDDVAQQFHVKSLDHAEETRIDEEFGHVFFLRNFPFHTDPFWNMKMEGTHARKLDVIIHGVETIGSAERSTNVQVMREMFNTISDGRYRDTLYSRFSKARVDKEMDEFLSFNFIERSGGAVGVTRMIRAMELHGLL